MRFLFSNSTSVRVVPFLCSRLTLNPLPCLPTPPRNHSTCLRCAVPLLRTRICPTRCSRMLLTSPPRPSYVAPSTRASRQSLFVCPSLRSIAQSFHDTLSSLSKCFPTCYLSSLFTLGQVRPREGRRCLHQEGVRPEVQPHLALHRTSSFVPPNNTHQPPFNCVNVFLTSIFLFVDVLILLTHRLARASAPS